MTTYNKAELHEAAKEAQIERVTDSEGNIFRVAEYRGDRVTVKGEVGEKEISVKDLNIMRAFTKWLQEATFAHGNYPISVKHQMYLDQQNLSNDCAQDAVDQAYDNARKEAPRH